MSSTALPDSSQPPPLPPGGDDGRMPLWMHLTDLRQVIVRGGIATGLAWCLTYYYCDRIGAFLQQPLLRLLPADQQHLYYLGVAEKFMVYLKLSIYSALGMVSPYLLYQVWWFISPGLYRNEKRFLAPFIVFGSFTFLLGMSFGYWVVIPYCYKFLLNFGPTVDQPRITLNQYFTLTIKMLMMLGAIFELPLLLVLMGKFELIDAKVLTKYRRHAVLLIAVLSALISPTPDAFTMVIVMAPLYLLYELSIFMVMFVTPRN